ncbi:hypothetical protein [Streptomyces monashensis]|uniref:hypothetical protein n=1 Tax=Streptomyces monashensis TaxID=1678012 RepID=UPI003182E09D
MRHEQLSSYWADLGHLKEVEALARTVVAARPHLDVLVNSAGMTAPERHTVTADGNETPSRSASSPTTC